MPSRNDLYNRVTGSPGRQRPLSEGKGTVGSVYTAKVVQCVPRYDLNGVSMYNIVNVLLNAPATAANLLSIANVWEAWERAEGRVMRSNQCTAPSIRLTAMDGPGAPVLDRVYPAPPIVGAIGSTGAVHSLTIVVSLRTGLSGKSYHGRIYHCGLANSWTLPTSLNSVAVQGALITGYSALLTRLAVIGAQVCVLSLYSGKGANGYKAPRATGIATPVTGLLVGTRIDTQRRRLPTEVRP